MDGNEWQGRNVFAKEIDTFENSISNVVEIDLCL